MKSVKLMDVVVGLESLNDNCAQIIIADPPYNVGKDFGACNDNLQLEEYLTWCMQWFDEAIRVIKPYGTIYIYGYSEILSRISARISENNKGVFTRWLIWHYTNKTSPSSNFWQRSHESILVISKKKPIFNRDDVRVPYTPATIRNNGRKRSPTRGRFGSSSETFYTVNENGALPRDVLCYPSLVGGRGCNERAYWCQNCQVFVYGREKEMHQNCELIAHPTQKPQDLTRNLIKAAIDKSSNDNLVVVLFVGSGSELSVAVEMGCSVVGFEINTTFQKMGNAWIDRTLKEANDNIKCGQNSKSFNGEVV